MSARELINTAVAGPVMGKLFRMRSVVRADSVAIRDASRANTYAQLNDRINRLSNGLIALGIQRGDRIAIMSENRTEYIEIQLACAKIGAIAACQNWRQSDDERSHCIRLVSPRMLICSPRHAPAIDRLGLAIEHSLTLGDDYEDLLARSPAHEPGIAVHPEDGVLILYTSGTTGYPKGALISHRAMIARAALMFADWGLTQDEAYIAWSPLFHLAGADLSLGSLLQGGRVVIVDGFDQVQVADALASERVNWFVMVPGMIERTIEEVTRRGIKPKGIKLIGAMADLLQPQLIAELTRVLNAPFLNSFGATETGMAPASKTQLPIGRAPTNLDKQQSSFCEVRLVDDDDREVAVGDVGELTLRSTTLFSGYWNAEETNLKDFRGGWFHMGDMFRRNADGTLAFVDRKKYLIKSGGENIYPAEIEKILLRSDRIAEASVVRKRDPKWGEVPAAFIVRRDPTLTEADVVDLCRGEIAGYKLPKDVRFVDANEIPRSETGKIKRYELERMLDA
ncbi:MAG: AMP-binding protein [Burkholderiales bacterium]